MFSFVSRMDAGLFKRALVLALVCVFLCGITVPVVTAATDGRKPYIIPGDGDGPAGVQDAVVTQDRLTSDLLPLYLQLGPMSIGFVTIPGAPSKIVIWFTTSTTADALGDRRR